MNNLLMEQVAVIKEINDLKKVVKEERNYSFINLLNEMALQAERSKREIERLQEMKDTIIARWLIKLLTYIKIASTVS